MKISRSVFHDRACVKRFCVGCFVGVAQANIGGLTRYSELSKRYFDRGLPDGKSRNPPLSRLANGLSHCGAMLSDAGPPASRLMYGYLRVYKFLPSQFALENIHR